MTPVCLADRLNVIMAHPQVALWALLCDYLLHLESAFKFTNTLALAIAANAECRISVTILGKLNPPCQPVICSHQAG